MKPPPRPADGGPDERGVSLIIIALFLTALMIFAAVAIDGSGSYAARRSMQNAGDAGAMAGGLALYKAFQAAPPNGSMTAGTATDVYQQAFNQAITNDGGSLPTDGEDFCDFIDVNGNSLGVCASSGIPPASAVGVKVSVENARQSFFGSFAGQSTHTVRAHAAASIQPVGGAAAPLIVCGSTQNGGYDMLTDDGDGEPANGTDTDIDQMKSMSVLLPVFGWNGTNADTRPKNPSYATVMIQVNAPQGSTKCGSGSSSADGKGDGQFHGNGDQSVSPGNGNPLKPNNNTAVPVGNCYNDGTPEACVPCPTDLNALPGAGCDILLPVSDWAQGVGNNASYHIVTEAVFHILTGGPPANEKIVGWMDNPSGFKLTSTLSQTGTCPPGSALCVVKLIDFPTNGLLE